LKLELKKQKIHKKAVKEFKKGKKEGT
jgi:hypothetical protein